MTRARSRLWTLLIVVAGACCTRPQVRPAYAVGTYVGGGSWLFGPSDCTYDAPPSVARLVKRDSGETFMAELTGEGEIAETCRNTKTVYDVVRATAGRIDGPANLQAGVTSGPYAFVPLAGGRELRGVEQGGASPAWSLGKDCEGVAVFGVVSGSQDTGGGDITRTLVAARAGACTVTATILGITAARTIQVR